VLTPHEVERVLAGLGGQPWLGRVQVPGALGRRYPAAERSWPWQWVSPAAGCYRDRIGGGIFRHHVHESTIERAVQAAVAAAGMATRASCRTLRRSFTMHLLGDGYDIRTVQELLGHNDVKTTMTYTHVLNAGGKAVRSPAERLARRE